MKVGDYVWATKYSDGDPRDQWCIGFYHSSEGGRHFVVDEAGNQFRANGFRYIQKISKKRGEHILKNKGRS